MAKNKRVTIPKSLVDTFVRVWNETNGGNWYVEADDINCGWCYQFAIVVKRTLNVDVDIYSDTDGGHCWVKIDGYYYDSEHLKGTRNILSFSCSDDYVGPISVRRTQEIWHRANSGPVQLKTINKVVREWKQLYSRT